MPALQHDVENFFKNRKLVTYITYITYITTLTLAVIQHAVDQFGSKSRFKLSSLQLELKVIFLGGRWKMTPKE